jgi:hypothetical protein
MKQVLFWIAVTVAALLCILLAVFGILLTRHPT